MQNCYLIIETYDDYENKNIRICMQFFNYMVTTDIVGYVHLKEAAKSLLQSSDGFIRL